MGCILKQGGGLYTRMRIGSILLAAGQGSRMCNIPKSLIELQGVPLINRHLISLSGAGVDEVVVVTGFYHDAVERMIEHFPVQIVRNLNPEAGQASSVRLGLESIGRNFDMVIMMLCDQPMLATQDLTQLIAAFKKKPHGEILIPLVNGQRGNPVIVSKLAIDKILDSGKHMVCRKFIDENPDHVYFYDTDNERFIQDIDSLVDLDTFERKTGFKLSLPNPQKYASVSNDLKDRSSVKDLAIPAYLALQKLRA